VSFIAFQCNADGGQTSTLAVNAAQGRPMPDTLFGVFYEVGNYYAHISSKLNITKLLNSCKFKVYETFFNNWFLHG